MTNLVDQFKGSRQERVLERSAKLAPVVGLAGTTYGIISAFKRLESASPASAIAPGMSDAMIFTAICIPIFLLVSFALDWLCKK